MDDAITLSFLNDFIFCPVSIYFHNLYGNMDTMLYQSEAQINGKEAHRSIDTGTYSTKKNVLMGIDVYSEKYNIIGKIDLFDVDNATLTERKKKIKVIYDGYIFQIYAQYYALTEMGYKVDYLKLYSIDDNKSYLIEKPENNSIMHEKFECLVYDIKHFKMESFAQENRDKCTHCIYAPACDRGIGDYDRC